jgi:hypothetical protein
MTQLLAADPFKNPDPELIKSIPEAYLAAVMSGGSLQAGNNVVYIIHVVHWKIDTNTSMVSSKWYLYKFRSTGKGAGNFVRIGPGDIYQKTHAMFISLQYSVADPASTLPLLTYTVSTTKKTPNNLSALSSIASTIFGIAAPKGIAGGAAPPPVVIAQSIASEIDSNGASLPLAWSFTMTAKGGSDNDATGDCSRLTKTGKCTVSESFTSNDAEYWNIGINIIPYGPRENRYAQSTSGTITETHTLHNPLIAVVDMNPFACKWSMNKGPYIQAGVPLTGAAFHLPYVGLAQPIPGLGKIFPISFSIFGGVMFMKQTFPTSLAVGQTATTAAFNANLVTDRAIKGVFGIEVPLGAIISKVKGATFK